MISLIDMLQHVQKVDAVLIVSENSLLFVATGGDVIDSTCVFDAKGARHLRTLAQKRENVKTKDLTLLFDLYCLVRKFETGWKTEVYQYIEQKISDKFGKDPNYFLDKTK